MSFFKNQSGSNTSLLTVVSCALLCLIIITDVQSQSCVHADTAAVDDTLRPQQYFPLAVGNIWEYEVRDGADPSGLIRQEVVGYAYIKDVFYYNMKENRYSVSGDSIAADTVWNDLTLVTDTSYVTNGAESPVEWNFRFNAPWSSCYDTSFPDGDTVQVTVDGERPYLWAVTETGQPIDYEVDASKSFDTAGVATRTYAHGIGLVHVENAGDTTNLVYAMIDGIEYGTSISDTYSIPVTIDRVSIPARGLTVFPVPASDILRVQVLPLNPSGVVAIYDAQGRQVMRMTTQISSNRVDLPVRRLAPGVYFLTIIERGQHVHSARFVIAR